MSDSKTVQIYYVNKPIRINEHSVCNVGDILMVDESGESTSAVNLTQNFQFCPFAQYESVKLLAEKTFSWNEFLSVWHGQKPLYL
jgi:hypothetical protein